MQGTLAALCDRSNVDGTRDVTQRVTAAVSLINAATLQLHVGVAIYICTGIGCSVAKGIPTVTAAKHVVYLVCPPYGDMRLRNSSSIAATIDKLDTGQVAVMDIDLRLFCRRGCDGHVGSLVTASIDCIDIISDVIDV